MGKALSAKIEELEADLRRRDERIKELAAERDEALERVGQVREQLEDMEALRQQWIEALDMRENAEGKLEFPFDEWRAARDKLHDDYIALVNKWNRNVAEFNATIRPRNVGRPLQASDDQVATVRQMRKAKTSLRVIAERTGLTLRTVRTILDQGTGKERSRTNELRRLSFDKLATANHRARKRLIDSLPARITRVGEEAIEIIKAAKGLGKGGAT
jgi:uncharacterized protein YydD (DUF2326 family)